MKILIVDDNEDARDILKKTLSHAGYALKTARNGREALKMAEADAPDMIISDILMPEMDGFRLCGEVKSRSALKQVPFIFYTATYLDKKDEKLALALGASRYIAKPMAPPAFLNVIHEVLEEHKSGALPVPEKPREDEAVLFKMYETSVSKKLEKKVSELTLYKNIFLNSKDAIAIVDRKGLYMAQNAAHQALVGFSDEELAGKTPAIHLGESSFSEVYQQLSDKGIYSGAVVSQAKSGKKMDVELLAFPICDDEGRVSCYVGIKRDLTERKRAEEKIRTLSQAVEQSPVSVIITDMDANIEYVNSAFERVSGYREEEVLGKNPRILKSGNTPRNRYKVLWEALTSGKSWKGEFQNQKKSGEIYWEHVHIAPVLDESGVSRHYLAVKEDITYRKQQEEKLFHQAHFDALTDLPNRFLSLDRLKQRLKETERGGDLLAVLFVDLDDFKKINDTLGHEAGDRLLIEAAQRLCAVARRGDTVGRLGGDEFILLLGGLTDAADTRPVVRNILEEFKRPFTIEGRQLLLSASVGIALSPGDGQTPSELLRCADSAMYHAKALGRNTFAYFTQSMNHALSRRLALEEQMQQALAHGEFTVFYQAKVDVTSRRVIGAEALLRWDNLKLGQVAPGEFIPVAEQSGFIVPLGQFILSEALEMTGRWHKRARDRKLCMAVNLSPRQFRDPGLVPLIKNALDHCCGSGECLELEITEDVLMSGHSEVDQVLAALSRLGISIAMDDFGTGYSSLSYLRSYPFDVLKIDSSFVRDITVDPGDRALILGAISMAHGLGLKVVAEGVETEAQLTALKALDCDYAQGYLFGKPMPEDDFFRWTEGL